MCCLGAEKITNFLFPKTIANSPHSSLHLVILRSSLYSSFNAQRNNKFCLDKSPGCLKIAWTLLKYVCTISKVWQLLHALFTIKYPLPSVFAHSGSWLTVTSSVRHITHTISWRACHLSNNLITNFELGPRYSKVFLPILRFLSFSVEILIEVKAC